MQKQKFIVVVMTVATASLALQPAAVLAASTQEVPDTLSVSPEQKAAAKDGATTAGSVTTPVDSRDTHVSATFVISAYYSPIEGQRKYVTGSFAGDVRLNGEGVHSADGSIVYPGMVAAPKNYPFGTKMNIPGIGTVAVHDRGGAIVNAGQRNQAYDRIDVWMGYGDAGLQRALHWGRRTVQAIVYGVDPSIQENVTLEGYSEAEKVAQTLTGEDPKTFVEDLSVNDKSAGVKKLQQGLKKLGYYNSTESGEYDDLTRQAVVKFQIAVGVVDSENDFGAGFFGPETRRKLEDALNLRSSQVRNHLPQTPLNRDDQGNDVRKLQQALKKLGYDVDATGIYDEQTVDAILKFQKDQNVVASEADFGAGVFGPRTMQVLASKLVGVTFEDANAAAEASVVPVVIFTKDLKLGDKGDDVRKLQEELKRMNYLGVEASGYYGDVTQHAVMKFQEGQGLIDADDRNGAGVFGATTRARVHAIIGQRQHVEQNMK